MIPVFVALLASPTPALAAGRPAPATVRSHPQAGHPPPRAYGYRPYYTRWYGNPYYRHVYYPPRSRVVMSFGYDPHPWSNAWVPPARSGWVWVAGRQMPGGYWAPGYWRPVGTSPVGYTYVAGYWSGSTYVDGWYRIDARPGWTWVAGGYVPGGRYVPGHWRPLQAVPAGFLWEPGFYDGEQYVDGFWRPAFRNGYAWVPAGWNADGTWVSGYWRPSAERPGFVWIPGWFDGQQWIEGYWESATTYERRRTRKADDVPGEDAPPAEPPDRPLALPVP